MPSAVAMAAVTSRAIWASVRPARRAGATATAAVFDVLAALVAIPLNVVFMGIVREVTRKQLVEMTFGGGDRIVS